MIIPPRMQDFPPKGSVLQLAQTHQYRRVAQALQTSLSVEFINFFPFIISCGECSCTAPARLEPSIGVTEAGGMNVGELTLTLALGGQHLHSTWW